MPGGTRGGAHTLPCPSARPGGGVPPWPLSFSSHLLPAYLICIACSFLAVALPSLRSRVDFFFVSCVIAFFEASLCAVFSGVEPFSFCAAFVACLCAVFHPWALLQLNSRQPPGYFIGGPAKVLLVLCRYGAPWSAYQYHSFLGLLVSGHAGKRATETHWS